MGNIKFTLPAAETVTLAGNTVDKLIRAGDGDAALLYLYILKTNGESTSEQAAAALGKTPGGIATAMAVLSRLGLIKCDETVPDVPKFVDKSTEIREYTAEEIAHEVENSTNFRALVDEAQRSLGKLLSPDDLQRLFGIYDGLRLPPEVIVMLITHCISESRRRGNVKMPSMRYVEKAAYTWEGEGIFSLDRAEEYLKNLEKRRGAHAEMKSALQIKERELSASEQRYVDAWIEMGFKADAVEIAYDRTMLKTGRLAWGYMDSIMKSWHGKQLMTPSDIIEKDQRTPAKTAQNAPQKRTIGQKFGEPNVQDLEEMKRFLKKLKEE